MFSPVKILATIALMATATQACYFKVVSSTVGTFPAQRSEPSDHGGAAQFFTFTHGACTLKGEIFDGCSLTFSSKTGCGNVSYSVCPAEKPCA